MDNINATFIVILALLATFGAQVTADCFLAKPSVEMLKSTIFYELNGEWQLLRRSSVPDKAKVHFVCNDMSYEEAQCLGHSFDKEVPIYKCQEPLRSEVRRAQEVGNCPFNSELYHIGFDYRNMFFTLYSSCYNPQTKVPLFIIEKIYPHSFRTMRQYTFWTTDDLITPYEGTVYVQGNVHNRFFQLLGIDPLLPHVEKIDRGHMAACQNYIFPSHKSATFKLINAVPQFGYVNNRNWAEIEEWVRKEIQYKSSSYQTVISGGHDVLQLEHSSRHMYGGNSMVDMYLGEGQTFPIPKWTYKIIYINGQYFIFVTYNNSCNKPTETPDPICIKISCPLYLLPRRDFGETYCCDVNDFKRNVMPNLENWF